MSQVIHALASAKTAANVHKPRPAARQGQSRKAVWITRSALIAMTICSALLMASGHNGGNASAMAALAFLLAMVGHLRLNWAPPFMPMPA